MSVRERARAVLRDESRRRTLLLGGAAALATAIWMLHAVHSDLEIGNAAEDVRYHLGFTLDETFAVLNGRTPLVNFTAQYGSLWPFAIALPMLAFGKTVLTSRSSCARSAALRCSPIYGVFRRVARSATAALLLYLPFLATSLFQIGGTLAEPLVRRQLLRELPAALRAALPARVADRAPHRARRQPAARAVAAVHARRDRAAQQRRLRDRGARRHRRRAAVERRAPSLASRAAAPRARRGGRPARPPSRSSARSRSCAPAHCRSRRASSTTRARTRSAASR